MAEGDEAETAGWRVLGVKEFENRLTIEPYTPKKQLRRKPASQHHWPIDSDLIHWMRIHACRILQHRKEFNHGETRQRGPRHDPTR